MKTKVLKINYDDFQAILKEWEKYTFVLLKELAKDMPTSFEMDSYKQQFITAPFANEINLSDLANFLWKSLERGADEVDAVHDEFFVSNQVSCFKSEFSSPEIIANWIDYLRKEYTFYQLDSPMESFVRLGKPAQLQIIQEDFLETATANFKKAKQIIEKKDYEAEQERIKIRDEKRIIDKIKKKVRELDNLQCVFCGREYRFGSFGYLQIHNNEFEIDNVFLSCNYCLKEGKKQSLEPNFGRFARTNKEI